MQRGVVGLTGGNRRPAFDGLETRELRMGTTPTQFLARKCAYYAAPRRLGPHRGLGRPAGRRSFDNVPTFRFSRMLHATTREDRASTLVRSAALLSVSGEEIGCERPSIQREVLLGRIGSLRNKENGVGLASEPRFGQH